MSTFSRMALCSGEFSSFSKESEFCRKELSSRKVFSGRENLVKLRSVMIKLTRWQDLEVWIFNRNSRCGTHRKALSVSAVLSVVCWQISSSLGGYTNLLHRQKLRNPNSLLIFNLWPFNSCDLLNGEEQPVSSWAICKTNKFTTSKLPPEFLSDSQASWKLIFGTFAEFWFEIFRIYLRIGIPKT